jgi:DNA-binding transcriptional ArsR family regulator
MVQTRRLTAIFKALAVEARLRIVQLLREKPLCVNALAARLGMTAAGVSQHLRVLRKVGVVEGEKRGYYVHYRLNEETLAAWREEIDKLLDPKHGACTDTKGARKCAAAMTRRKAVGSRTT